MVYNSVLHNELQAASKSSTRDPRTNPLSWPPPGVPPSSVFHSESRLAGQLPAQALHELLQDVGVKLRHVSRPQRVEPSVTGLHLRDLRPNDGGEADTPHEIPRGELDRGKTSLVSTKTKPKPQTRILQLTVCRRTVSSVSAVS